MAITAGRMLRVVLLALCALGSYLGQGADARAQGACPDDGGGLPKACTKEIRIWNNTDRPLYAILQASIQKTTALGCTVRAKGGGDVWLQAALGDTKSCYAVEHDYYAYINPSDGIPPGEFAAIDVPWWSKRPSGAPDEYVDWWRAARVYLFDDQTALDESYAQLKGTGQVAFTADSPKVRCKNSDGNTCTQLQIFQVTPEATIGSQTPYQLNEFTFASVSEVTDGGTKGGQFINFNQGYNVSNVDQVYLPLAIEPVREPADVGYMGTTMSVKQFRKQLADFAGTDQSPDKPVWPIYNNPVVDGQPRYPDAGIRVPSTQTALNFYMNPFYFGGTDIPQIIPKTPPKVLADLIDQWGDCTASTPSGCPEWAIYQEINDAFLESYKNYIDTCSKVPSFLQPVTQNPPQPKPVAYLAYVYGWVPFNFACSNEPLPTANQPPAGSRVPIDYMSIQYNYEDASLKPQQWFNPYVQLIHGSVNAGGLKANAYAFSIDDHSSFQSNSGGSLPGGLIFAVGGAEGLPNKNQVPPPTPPFYKYFDFSVNLGAPSAGEPYWLKYGICSDTADVRFDQGPTNGYGLGIDPALYKINNNTPCNITLMDSENRKYRIVVLKADVPPDAIWPEFKPNAQNNFDPKVLACPALQGFVAPGDWCNFTNETADPSKSPGQYSISTRVPLPASARKK